MRLDFYQKGTYQVGASRLKLALWYVLGAPLLKSSIFPFSALKVAVLRLFGACVAEGVRIKPGVKVKFPWKLSIGAFSWIGEDVWIDNLAQVTIGSHCCLSQGAYLCTGNHDWSCASFDLKTDPICLEDHVWLGARCSVAPGTTIAAGAVVSMGSHAQGTLEKWYVYHGNPADRVRKRPHEAWQDVKRDAAAQKILFINQTFYPDQSASSQYLSDLAEQFSQRGDEVSVLTGQRGYLKKDDKYSARELWKGIAIHRAGGLVLKGRQRWKRVLSALFANASLALKLLTFPRQDRIVVMTSPPLIAVVALLLAKKPRKEFIYWVMDLNPDQAIQAGWLKPRSPIALVLSAALKLVLMKSSKVIVLDRHMRERILAKGVAPEKVRAMPLWCDVTKITPVPKYENRFAQTHGLGDKFVVMYSGNMSVCHPLDTMLSAAEIMRDDDSTMFVFIGDGPRNAEVRKFTEEKNLKNICFLPYQERSDLSHSLSAADLHVVSLGEPYVGILHPSKIYGILSAGRPPVLIGPRESFIHEEVIARGLGARVDHGDVSGLLRVIQKGKHLPQEKREELEKRLIQCAEHNDAQRNLEELVKYISE